MKYRRIETGTLTDLKVAELSRPQPNGQSLWQYLLVGRRTTIFPGLVVASEAVMASDLGWPISADLFGPGSGCRCLRDAWLEIEERGMAVADWDVGLVVLPRALLDRLGSPREVARPTSPNALRGWAKTWEDIPECELAAGYLSELSRFAAALDRTKPEKGNTQAYRAAFRSAFATAESRSKASFPHAEAAWIRAVAKQSESAPRRINSRQQLPVDGVSISEAWRAFNDSPSNPQALPDASSTGPRPARAPVPVPVTSGESPSPPPEGGGGFGPNSGSGFQLPDPGRRSSEITSTDPSADPPPDPRRIPGSDPSPEYSSTPSAPGHSPAGPLPATGAVLPVHPPTYGAPVYPPDTPEARARRRIAERIWNELNSARSRIAAEFDWSDVRGVHPMDPGVRELNARLSESGASGEQLARHVLAVAEAEARRSRSVRYLSGQLFEPRWWRRAVAMRLEDAEHGTGTRHATGPGGSRAIPPGGLRAADLLPDQHAEIAELKARAAKPHAFESAPHGTPDCDLCGRPAEHELHAPEVP